MNDHTLPPDDLDLDEPPAPSLQPLWQVQPHLGPQNPLLEYTLSTERIHLILSLLTPLETTLLYLITAQYCLETISAIVGFSNSEIRSCLSSMRRRLRQHPAIHALARNRYPLPLPARRAYASTREVARVSGLTTQHINRLCRNGHYPGAYQDPDGRWWIPRAIVQLDNVE